MSQIRRCTFVFFTVIIGTAIACSEDVPVVIDAGEDASENADVEQPEDTGFDEDAVDAADTAVDENENEKTNDDKEEEIDREECLENEEFGAPTVNIHGEEVYSEEDFTAEADGGYSRRAGTRPPTPYKWAHAWLEEGDYYIHDINWWAYGYRILPREFEMLVLHEGEPVPFAIDVVEEGEDQFVPREEIESWDEDEFGIRATVELRDQEVLSYTLVVPPWVFEEKGSYNFHVVPLAQWDDAEEWDWWAFAGRYALHAFSYFHVHHGSECPLPERRDIPTREMGEDAHLWEKWEASEFVYMLGDLFLAPPTEIYDWTRYEPYPEEYPELNLAQVFESPEPQVVLDLYAIDRRGIGAFGRQPFNEETLYLVMRNGEIIEEFLLEGVPLITSMDDYNNEETPGARIPIEVELTEEPATYRVVAITVPFEQYDDEAFYEKQEWAEEELLEPTHISHFQPSFSSAIQMKYVPE